MRRPRPPSRRPRRGLRSAASAPKRPCVVQDVYFRAPARSSIAGQPVLALLPPATAASASTCPSRVLATSPSATTVGGRLRRLLRRASRAKVSFIAQRGGVHAAGDLQPRGRRKLVFRVEAKPPASAALPLGLPVTVIRRRGIAMRSSETPSRDDRHRRRGPDQVLRRPRRRARPDDAGQARADLRLPRPERQRQDDDHPHALRAADARQRAAAPASATTSARSPTRSSATSAT